MNIHTDVRFIPIAQKTATRNDKGQNRHASQKLDSPVQAKRHTAINGKSDYHNHIIASYKSGLGRSRFSAFSE